MTLRDLAYKIAFARGRWCWLIGHFWTIEYTGGSKKWAADWECHECGATKPATPEERA